MYWKFIADFKYLRNNYHCAITADASSSPSFAGAGHRAATATRLTGGKGDDDEDSTWRARHMEQEMKGYRSEKPGSTTPNTLQLVA